MHKIVETELSTELRETGIRLFTLSNNRGTRITLCNLGATVISIQTADKIGNRDDITLGFDNIEDYIKDTHYFGCIVGRYANRIANGRFTFGRKHIN